jgi:HNH endonuclease
MSIKLADVLRVIKEFDTLGDQGKFLEKYGFRKPKHKYLVFEGKHYPARAVWAAAHKPPLKSDYDSSRMWHDTGAFEKLDPRFRFIDKSDGNMNGRSNGSKKPTAVPTGKGQPDQREYTTNGYLRDSRVRKYVLNHADGVCEIDGCDKAVFFKPNGKGYLESHHIVPVSEKGKDEVENVVALCPNHHREAHHGKDAKNLRVTLLALTAKRKLV